MIKKFICLILLLVCISCTSTDKDTNTRSDEIILDDPENLYKIAKITFDNQNLELAREQFTEINKLLQHMSDVEIDRLGYDSNNEWSGISSSRRFDRAGYARRRREARLHQVCTALDVDQFQALLVRRRRDSARFRERRGDALIGYNLDAQASPHVQVLRLSHGYGDGRLSSDYADIAIRSARRSSDESRRGS